MSKPRKQIILGAYLGGVHQHTLWPDPATGSQIDFATVRHVAQTAERGKFDFFFLAEGLILRERIGLIVDRDVIGRPDTLPVLAAIATVTEHLGLIGTLNTAFNEPYELARQLASFDHLSGGRAGRLERGDLARRIYRAAVQRPPQSARPPGDPAGRRLPIRAGLRRRQRRRDLLPLSPATRGPGLLPGHPRPRRPARAPRWRGEAAALGFVLAG